MNPRVAIVLVTLAVAGYLWLRPAQPPPPGVAAPETPVQELADPAQPAESWPVADGYRATALASYRIHARVIGKERYRYDRCAPIAPVDLALGWGRMSDSSVYGKLAVSQRGRYYLYEWDREGPPIPKNEIVVSSANNHIIPADAGVARALDAVRLHDVVWMEGALVEVTGPGGFRWRSWLSREDSGSGACELFRVTSLVVEPPGP